MLRLPAILLVLACGKSGDEAPPAAPADPPVAPAVDAAPAARATAVDAAARATALPGPPRPPGAICSGRWTARLDFGDDTSCTEAQLAPYRDLDVTVSAGPGGWVATVTKPAGLTTSRVEVWWTARYEGRCSADVFATKPGVTLNVDLAVQDDRRVVFPRVYFGEGEQETCRGIGRGPKNPATFEPDQGALPPTSQALIALTGSYDLDLALPAGYECDAHPWARLAAELRFTVDIDRTYSNALMVEGLGWIPNLVMAPGNHRLRIDAHHKKNKRAELFFDLTVTGSQVTGTAGTFYRDHDGDPICPNIEAKVAGTHTPPP